VRRVIRIVLVLAALVVVVNWTWGNLPGEGEADGRFATVDGVRIHYVEHAGAEPAVVLIHGLPGTHHDFDRVVRLLPSRRTISIDRPGFGFSDGGYHRFARQLELLHGLLEQLDVRRPVLAGHSYGGTIALAYAERYPDDVRGLVLVDAAAGGTDDDGFERAQAHLLQVLSWPVVQPLADVTFSGALRRIAAEMGDKEAFDPDPVDDVHKDRLLASNMRHEDLDAYAGEVLEAQDAVAGVNRGLGDVHVPTVVIQGRGDKLVEPERGRRIAREVPGAHLVLVAGGHMAPYLYPGIVASAVRTLLSK
jgi:pimeloyl-ACP methyl ester carboxylesterase